MSASGMSRHLAATRRLTAGDVGDDLGSAFGAKRTWTGSGLVSNLALSYLKIVANVLVQA
jgi:hypothetical protein